MKQWMWAAMAAMLLTGCGTKITPIPPGPSEQVPHSRRVLAVSGTALWGVNFFLTVVRSHGVKKVRGITGSGRSSYDYFPYDVTDRQANPVYAGKGDLERLSEERFAFSVPANEALVINQLSGKGVVYLNGYAIALPGGSMPVHYVFGAGELVVVRFVPDVESRSHSAYRGQETAVTKFHDMGVSGYLGDPSLVAGGKEPK